MKLFTLLSLFVVRAGGTTELENVFPQLGINSLDMLDFKYEVTVDEGCEYHFKIDFTHNPDFSVGSPDTCVPSAVSEYDGKPMLSARYHYEEFPVYIEEATGFNHISLDYNPCGHPAGGWLSPHYDVHFYMISPEERATVLTCDTIPGLPVCDPEVQSTENGRKFFELQRSEAIQISKAAEINETLAPFINMPENFAFTPGDGIINMGMHCYDISAQPANPMDWINPSLIFTAHEEVICFEPMLPLHFVVGEEDHVHSEDIAYVDQTISTLPSMYEARFDASGKVTTVEFKGKSNLCLAEYEAAKTAFEEPENPEEDSAFTLCSFILVIALSLAIIIF